VSRKKKTLERLVILDVGHGNCAVLHSQGHTCVIDAGPGTTLLEYLRAESISELDVVMLSHADQDHIGGLIGLLTSGTVKVHRIFLNTDSEKASATWADLVYELGRQWERGELGFEASITAQLAPIAIGKATLEVIGPSPAMAALGPGQQTPQGARITSNTISAVIRINYNGSPVGLLAGDLDGAGLADIAARAANMQAPIVVYPHHGGGSGTNTTTFATNFVIATNPSAIAFSNGRTRFSNPQPAVVQAARAAAPAARIICTQLATTCAKDTPRTDPGHLTSAVANGRDTRRCCGGSIVVDLGKTLALYPDQAAHLTFIRANAAGAMCV
jgi:beta-lactamase superfamily II metal-dependent hydrolase